MSELFFELFSEEIPSNLQINARKQLENLLKQTLGVNNFQSGELFIESEQKDKLPLGVFCRFAKTT